MIILKMIKMRGLDSTVAITVNYIVAAAISLLLSPIGVPLGYVASAPWFAVSMVLGVMFMLSLAVYAVSAQRSGVAVTTISGRAAMAIPVIFAFIAFGEQLTALKVISLVAILFALWLILKQDGGAKGGGAPQTGWWLKAALPLAVFLFNGANDTIMQFAKRMRIPDSHDNMLFNATMFAASALTGLIFHVCEKKGHIPAPSLRTVLWGVLLGVVNAVCCIGILYALETMDGSVFYPLYYAGAVIISTIVGVWLFRERLSPTNYAGIALALAAIVLLAS